MKRVGFAMLAIVSFLAACAASMLWLRSARAYETLAHWETRGGPARGGEDYQLISVRGQIQYQLTTVVVNVPGPQAIPSWFGTWTPGKPRRVSEHWYGGSDYTLNVLGYDRPHSPVFTSFCRTVWVPHWIIVFLGAVLPSVWIALTIARAYRRKQSEGKSCPNCSYSLTGNTSGVCPECGAQI